MNMKEKPKYRMGRGEQVFLSLMIGMPILGIISAVAIPAMLGSRKRTPPVQAAATSQAQAPLVSSPSTPPEPLPPKEAPPANAGPGSESLQDLGLPADLVPVVPITSLEEILPRPDLEYPPVAKAARIQGTVLLEIAISAKGYPISVDSLDGPPMLRKAAEQWQMKRRFRPPMINGENRPVTVRNEVKFSLQ